MSFGRHILAGAALALAAGCTVPSVRTVGDTSALNIVSVSVDAEAVQVEGRPLEVTRSRLERDFQAAISAALAERSDPAGTPASVAVSLTQLRLAPPVERIVAGTSSATATLSVTQAGGEAQIVPPTVVTGNTENFRAAGWIGIVTTRTVENDYRGTVNGFAQTLGKALFGSEQ